MSFTELPAPQKQAAHEQQDVVDDFEAEFLADLEETDDQVESYSDKCTL